MLVHWTTVKHGPQLGMEWRGWGLSIFAMLFRELTKEGSETFTHGF